MYAKHVYSVHMPLYRLAFCRSLSFLIFAFCIFVAKFESVFSKPADSSPPYHILVNMGTRILLRWRTAISCSP